VRTTGPLGLTMEERTELERRVRAQTTPHRARQCAQVVLLAADGVTGHQIATVGLSPRAVCTWRIRSRDLGLEDAQRSVRALVYEPTDRHVLTAKATSEHAEFTAQWRHFELADAMAAGSIASAASQITQFLAKGDARPHKMSGRLTRKDTSEFRGRAADLCGLYLSRPENAVVLSIDEKTGINAKSCEHPTTPVSPGRPARRVVEWGRHGTPSLLAVLDVTAGKVTATVVARNDSVSFISFSEETGASIAEVFAIRVVLGKAPRTPRTPRRPGARHPRLAVHHALVHASWLDQVECFFSVLSRKVLRPGELPSREDLVARMIAFMDHHSERARPVTWVYDAKVAA